MYLGQKLPIYTYPNPILSKPSQEVHFPLSDEDNKLIMDMWATVAGQGIGLAAPQVGVNKRILIIKLSEDFNRTELKKMGLEKNGTIVSDFLMINPKIIWYSDLECQMVEGCLSFPNQYYQIWRPANIKVEFYNQAGQLQTLTAKDWLSRVIQHEVDHLDAKLFINKGGDKIENPDQTDQKYIVD